MIPGESVVGSCCGAFSAVCCCSLASPKCGDFRGHKYIPRIIDVVMVLLPFTILLPLTEGLPKYACDVSLGIALAGVLVNVINIAYPEQMTDRYYGLRILTTVVFAITALFVHQIFRVEISDSIISVLSIVGSLAFGVVLAVGIADVVFRMNSGLRQQISCISNEWMILIVKLALVVLSIYMLLVAYAAVPSTWLNSIVSLVFLVLSVWSPYNLEQRGSIVSASLTLLLVALTVFGSVPILLPILAFTLLNNFSNLQTSDHGKQLPLIERQDVVHIGESAERAIGNLLILFVYFSISPGGELNHSLAYITAVIASSWTLLAPVVLHNRSFHH